MNLSEAAKKLTALAKEAAAASNSSAASVCDQVASCCEGMLQIDIAANKVSSLGCKGSHCCEGIVVQQPRVSMVPWGRVAIR